MKKLTKTERVFNMLKAGHTVSHLTVVPLRVGNLNDVIRTIRRYGWLVHTVTTTDADGQLYTQYRFPAWQRNFISADKLDLKSLRSSPADVTPILEVYEEAA